MTLKVSKKDKIIRVGDCVRVVKPELFVRCGYPLTLDAEQESVEEKHGDDIRKFLGQIGIGKGISFSNEVYVEAAVHKIVRAIAYASVKQKGFGGSERSIYTTPQEYLKDKVVRVYEVFFVKTGTYHAPYYSCSFDGEEWEAGYLDKEKTHKILGIGTLGEFHCPGSCHIEAINVEKIIPD